MKRIGHESNDVFAVLSSEQTVAGTRPLAIFRSRRFQTLPLSLAEFDDQIGKFSGTLDIHAVPVILQHVQLRIGQDFDQDFGAGPVDDPIVAAPNDLRGAVVGGPRGHDGLTVFDLWLHGFPDAAVVLVAFVPHQRQSLDQLPAEFQVLVLNVHRAREHEFRRFRRLRDQPLLKLAVLDCIPKLAAFMGWGG